MAVDFENKLIPLYRCAVTMLAAMADAVGGDRRRTVQVKPFTFTTPIS